MQRPETMKIGGEGSASGPRLRCFPISPYAEAAQPRQVALPSPPIFIVSGRCNATCQTPQIIELVSTMAFHRNAQLPYPGLFTTTCLRSTFWFGYMMSSFLLVQAGVAFILTFLFVCLQLRCLRGAYSHQTKIRN